MSKFLNVCKRCLNPWIVGIIVMAIAGLIVVKPIIGVPALIAVLPIIGCTVMCAGMAFFMREKKDK